MAGCTEDEESHQKVNPGKKKRLLNKARRTKAEKDWEEFRSLRKQVKARMKKSHDDYVDGILQNSLEERPKKFWSFINSMKKDSNGIPTLKTDTGPSVNK